MSSDRPTLLSRRASLSGLLALAGCGLAPVYGTNGQAQVFRNAVAITAPNTVEGFRLRERLEKQFGRAQAPQFGLTVTMSKDASPATITTEDDITRFNINGTADWALFDKAGQALGTGSVSTFTGYSATGSTVATQTAATDAADRLAIALADLIAARLILLSAELAQ